MYRILTLLLAALVLLLLVGTARRHRAERDRRSVAAASAPAATAEPRIAEVPDSVRAAARALLARDAAQTYLDSMLASTDSLVRRWPDRGGRPYRIALLEGGSSDYGVRMADFVREGASQWQAADLGLWFSFTGDTTDADIVFQWRELRERNQGRRDHLRWSNSGRVVRAYVAFATRNAGDSLFTDEALLGAAVHELGHAMGLPHSTDSTDVMYPVTRVTVPSARDRATVRLLYALPPGSLRAAPRIGRRCRTSRSSSTTAAAASAATGLADWRNGTTAAASARCRTRSAAGWRGFPPSATPSSTARCTWCFPTGRWPAARGGDRGAPLAAGWPRTRLAGAASRRGGRGGPGLRRRRAATAPAGAAAGNERCVDARRSRAIACRTGGGSC